MQKALQKQWIGNAQASVKGINSVCFTEILGYTDGKRGFLSFAAYCLTIIGECKKGRCIQL